MSATRLIVERYRHIPFATNDRLFCDPYLACMLPLIIISAKIPTHTFLDPNRRSEKDLASPTAGQLSKGPAQTACRTKSQNRYTQTDPKSTGTKVADRDKTPFYA